MAEGTHRRHKVSRGVDVPSVPLVPDSIRACSSQQPCCGAQLEEAEQAAAVVAAEEDRRRSLVQRTAQKAARLQLR